MTPTLIAKRGGKEMSSVEQFATSAKRVTELPSPFREAIMGQVTETAAVHELIFSPAFNTTKFRSPASVLCVTNQRWLIALLGEDRRVIVVQSSYDHTLSVELTLILLYGQLKMTYAANGEAKSVALQFNTVMHGTYARAIQYILDAIDQLAGAATSSLPLGNLIVSNWPLKFRNFALLYAPKNSQFEDGVFWGETRAPFGRELAAAAALLLTDRHVVVIAEERITRWFQFRRTAKYGATITYFPLSRVTGFQIVARRRVCTLQIVAGEQNGTERYEILFPFDKQSAVSRFINEITTVHNNR
jgi:hypothetical protein